MALSTAKPGIGHRQGRQAVEGGPKSSLRDQDRKKVKLNINEIEPPELNPIFITESITNQNHAARLLQARDEAGHSTGHAPSGMRIRLQRASRRRREMASASARAASLPPSAPSTDYGQVHAHTTYGRVGVKVSIYRGDAVGGRGEFGPGDGEIWVAVAPPAPSPEPASPRCRRRRAAARRHGDGTDGVRPLQQAGPPEAPRRPPWPPRPPPEAAPETTTVQPRRAVRAPETSTEAGSKTATSGGNRRGRRGARRPPRPPPKAPAAPAAEAVGGPPKPPTTPLREAGTPTPKAAPERTGELSHVNAQADEAPQGQQVPVRRQSPARQLRPLRQVAACRRSRPHRSTAARWRDLGPPHITHHIKRGGEVVVPCFPGQVDDGQRPAKAPHGLRQGRARPLGPRWCNRAACFVELPGGLRRWWPWRPCGSPGTSCQLTHLHDAHRRGAGRSVRRGHGGTAGHKRQRYFI